MSELVIAILAAAVGAAVGAFLAPIAQIFISPYRWMSHALQRRFNLHPDYLFDVDFVSEQGQNIYVKNDDPNLRPYDESHFEVQVRFRLRAKEIIKVIDIKLDYPDVLSTPMEQVIDVNGNAVGLDNRYSLQSPLALEHEDMIDVRLWRKFLAKANGTWEGDMKNVQIFLGYTSQFSNGHQEALVYGKLAPGGRIENVCVSRMKRPTN